MRTTLTLDPDVAELLRESAHRLRHSFKEELNSAVRRGLNTGPKTRRAVFKVHPAAMGVRAGVDPAHLADVGDDAEVDAFLDLTRQLMASKQARP
jgi:hypothetical protein